MHSLKNIGTIIMMAYLANQPLSHATQIDESCGPIKMAYSGPWDYRKDLDKIDLVERAHFTPKVEKLLSGQSSGLGSNIDYTLIHFPNHPRALMSMIRLGERDKTKHPKGANFSIECYILRAIRFTPDDGTVHMIAGMYYAKGTDKSKAVEHMLKASELSDESGNLHYNLGLIYFDLKDFEKSLYHAHEAYRLGFILPGLKSKLLKVGKWRNEITK